MQVALSEPLTILAVDAPSLKNEPTSTYSSKALAMLARKVYLIFAAFEMIHSPELYSGLLGGGDFQGSRPLVLLLHLLLHNGVMPVKFHLPIFGNKRLEPEVVNWADAMLLALREKGVSSIGEALKEILSWR